MNGFVQRRYCALWWTALVAMVVLADFRATFATAQTNEPAALPMSTESIGPRVGVETRVGNGIGYRDGYVSILGFAPLWDDATDHLTFGDSRLLVGYDGKLGGNVAVGHRMYVPDWDRILGGYVSYDVRDTRYRMFHQFSGGFEALGKLVDVRGNFYIPLGAQTGIEPGFTPTGAPSLAGHNIVAPGLQRSDQALTGADMELAVMAPWLPDWRVVGGTYWFTGAAGSDAVGGRGGIEYRYSDAVRTSATVQNDRVFGTTFVFAISLTSPGSQRGGFPSPVNVPSRMTDTIQRLEMIVVERQERSGIFAYTDPRTNAPIHVVHVDATAVGGDGTVENPYTTLAEAQANSSPYNIIFVNDGNYTQGISLLANQRLLGDGTAHTVATREAGSILFPKNTPGATPTIFGVAGPAVTMASGSEVAGMTLDGNNVAGSQGVVGSSIAGFLVRNNTIINMDGPGIWLNRASGYGEITGNTVTDVVGDGISVAARDNHTLGMIVADNTITDVAGHGIRLSLFDTAALDGLLRNNTIVNPDGNGVQLVNSSTSTSYVTIVDSTFEKDSGDANAAAVNIESSAGALGVMVQDNTFELDDADIRGVRAVSRLDGGLYLLVNDNTFDGIYEAGIELISENSSWLTSGVARNTFDGAYTNGIMANATGNSRFYLSAGLGNTFTNPGQHGIWVNQTGTSDVRTVVMGNTFNDNAGADTDAGILLESSGADGSRFTATISGNTFNLVGDLEAIRMDASGDVEMMVDVLNNASTGALDNGIQATTSGNAELDLLIRGNSITNATNYGVLAESLGTSTLFARVLDNPNITGNSVGDLQFHANGGSLFLNLVNNANGGSIDLFRTAGLFEVNGNPVADNPAAAVFVDAGILINTGWDN